MTVSAGQLRSWYLILGSALVPHVSADRLLYDNGLRDAVACCEQHPDVTLESSALSFDRPWGQWSEFEALIADDFAVRDESWIVTAIGWSGDGIDLNFFPGSPPIPPNGEGLPPDWGEFEIAFYADDDGIPTGHGTTDPQTTALYVRRVRTFAHSRYREDSEYTIEWRSVLRPVVLPQGRYWVSIQLTDSSIGDGFMWYGRTGGNASGGLNPPLTEPPFGTQWLPSGPFWGGIDREQDFTLFGLSLPSGKHPRTLGPRNGG